MGIVDRLKNLFSGAGAQDAYWIYARCDHCQEVLRARVDLAHDLSVRYDSSGQVAGYFTRKTIIGSNQCFNQIEAKVDFDPRRRPLAHEISGGQLITKGEYEAASAELADSSEEKTTD